MFCYKCGQEIGEESTFCPSCGSKLKIDNDTPVQTSVIGANSTKNTDKADKFNGYAITSFVLSLCSLAVFSVILAPLGIIFGVSALLQFQTCPQKGKGLAMAGFIISIASLVFYIFIMIVFPQLMLQSTLW